MSYSEELLEHAQSLLQVSNGKDPSQVHLRRAISAAYYSLFHRISEDAVFLIAPNVAPSVQHRIQRWFDHGEMKKVCGRFASAKLDQPLLGLIGLNAPPDLQFLAKSFINLQEERHGADYDLSYELTWRESRVVIELAIRATAAWTRVSGSAEANIFILSLLLWKNWDKDRP
jgi:hypothetical protein